MFKTSKFMFLALFLATVGLLYNASAPSASTHANPVPEVAAAVRVFAEVQDIPGFRMPDWLSDNQGRTWVEDLPLDTYIVFKLPQPLSRILFQWMSSANYNYSETRYGAPKSYQIQISSDSADGIDGKWVTAADIQNNLVAARAHEIKGENIRWIRLRVTEGGTSIDEIDIHDLSRCQAGAYPDTWAFIGDSITADSFWRDAAAGKPFNARVNEICPERYPSMINLGIGGDNAKTLYERLQHTIDLNPGAYFWAVGIGTNGSENEEQYESYLRKIIQMLRENGKQPIVARIPYINIADASADSRIRGYNGIIDKLTAEYRLPSGPDLYTAFKEHSGDSGSYYRDPYHPNADGVEAINRLWAEAACRLAAMAATSEPAPDPKPILPSGKNKFTVEKTRIIGPDGSEFLIKGININGPGWCFPRDTLQDVRLIADVWQFNSVRLCAANKWDWFAADYNRDLDAIIKAFTDRGIVVILENHDYTGTYPSSTDEGGYDYEGNRLLPLSHLKNWWIDKAERFKNNPYVWFNIMNEPGASADRQSAELWFAVHDEIIGAIRDTGAENIIVADEHGWGQGGGYFGGEHSYDSAVIRMGPELNRKYGNLVYSLHVYDAWADGGDRFDRYFQDAKNRGLCVIIGEFGVMRGNAKQQSAVIAMYNSAIRHNIGRMYWAWDDSALPMTTEGCGWQIDKTDKAMPTNLTWAGELVWLDNRGRLSANLAIARPTASAVVVNGKNTAFDAYNIGGSNYFKLRDIAYVLSGSEKQFEVGWDGKKNAISLTSGAPYTPVGGEMAKKADGDKTAMPTSSDIFLDGKQIVLTAYNIGGYNYFKLRDMGRVLDFGVDWDEARNTIVIDTKKNYAPGPQNATSGSAWTQTSYNFQDLAELKNRSVFFAHNSVGQNIIDGLKALESSLIVGGVQAGAKGIAENYMGFNGDPAGKLGAFEKLLDEGGHRAQIAFFKFCYADFQAHTDVDGLFGEYTAKLGILGEKYPDITFIHVTVPLYHYNASWNNRVQHAFNEKLRAMYGALVFDLAAIESVDSLGNIALSRDGVTPALAEEWTDDGSHLNAAGGKRLASALIAFLAQVPLKK